ncbi:hypothetical protein INT43_006061 [Umbelopsis isabellina]|uniref:Methyltransferase domain-containing protein n=1 Tax=Mortierella isabellina TaxID=91625 RepID=A0A8H7UD04_MORIS|nr:hypothetical protein INT43_006061 [Umbelopsis isabellina]
MGAQLSRRRKISQSKKAAAKMLDQTQSNSSFSSKSKGTELFGRLYHDVESSAYLYPMDETEQDRLHGQHFALKALFGGDILEPVRRAIDLDDNCHVLDVGCGPGSWLLDLATSYPNSKFVGIDVVDMFPSTIRPPNTEFHVRNILDGLNMFSDNSFDFVQMRLFASVLKTDQWATTLAELKRVCRPGGIIQLLEVDYKVRGNSTVNQFTTKLVEVMAKRDLDGEMAKKLAPALTQAGFINVQTDHRSVAGASVTSAGKGKFVVATQPYDSPNAMDDAVTGEFWAGEPGVKQKREEAPYQNIDGRSTLDVMARAHRVNATQDTA